jgi:hypothetical protein
VVGIGKGKSVKNKPYPGLPRIQLDSSVDGVPTISHDAAASPGGSLSARDATSKQQSGADGNGEIDLRAAAGAITIY